MKRLIESLHPLERKVVPVLKSTCTFEELEAELPLMKEVEITRALQWLENKKVLKTTTTLSEIVSIDENGKNAVKNGLPERILINAIKKDISLKELKNNSKLTNEEFNISLGVLRKKVAITLNKGLVNITKAGEKFKDSKS